MDSDGVDELLAGAAGSLHEQAEVEDALREVALAARDTVPGVDQASIFMAYRNGRFATVAATASMAYELDELQYQLDEGSCVGNDAIHLAQLFSAQAANVLDRTIGDRQLNDALSTRKVIGHAVGILMERHRLDEQHALAHLIRTSRTSNTPLKLVAEHIVDDVASRALPPTTA